MSETRMPTQARSIEKRNKIIKMGFELMCEKGYHNTTTADIAVYANVSTGIVYQYFNDKKEIFIEGVKNYSNNILYPMIDILNDDNLNFNNLYEIIKIMIDKFIENHTFSKKAHEELIAMSHLDDDVGKIFKESEIQMSEKIVTLLEKNNIFIKNSLEKIHIIYGIIDTFCHEIVYHKHEKINYTIMQDEVINVIVYILKK